MYIYKTSKNRRLILPKSMFNSDKIPTELVLMQ